MDVEQIIRRNLQHRQDIQDKLKESVKQIDVDILKVIEGMKFKSLEEFRTALPQILRAVAKKQSKLHTPDIVRIARESVKMTKEIT